jgi:site-specific DNA recombinase
MNNCVLYARVSSQEQSEGYSIEAQVKLLRQYAQEKHLSIPKEFVEIESAKSSGRPIFIKMLEFVKERSIPIILVEKTDRLYRNPRDWITVEDANVEVHLVKENEVISDSSPSHQKFIHGIKVLMAKNFIDNLKEETKKGMREKAIQGGVPYLAPIGYLNNHGQVDVDGERAPLVVKAFELYASGEHSLSTLREEIYHLGLRTKKGAKLTKHGLEKTLKNPFYYGYFKWSGELWHGNHTPIISKDLYDKVVRLLAMKNRSTKPKSRKFAFRGLLKCGYCGCMITAEMQKGKYVYYTCTRGKGHCDQKYYREEEIDHLFSNAIGTLYIDSKIKSWITDALKQSHKDEKQIVEVGLKRLHSEYQKNQTYLHKIYDDKLDGIIPEDFFKTKFSELTQRQKEIDLEIDALTKKNLNYIDEGIFVLELLQDIKNQYDRATLEQKSKIMKVLLLNCELKGASTRYYWNKPFDLLFELGKTKKWGE